MTALVLALKGAIVLLSAGLAAGLWRRGTAAARHGVWAAAFAALLVLPALAAFGPIWEVPLLPAEPAAPALAGAPLPAAEASAASPAPATAPDARGPVPALAWLWGAGAALVLMGWGAALAAARVLVARAETVTDLAWLDALDRARRHNGERRHVRLLRSQALDVPVAWGLGHPAVVLPRGADAWDADRREAVLLHEVAHLARRDARTQVVAQLAVALHWFDPLAWWGYRRFLDERERACDDAVLRSGALPSAYAAHLIGIARVARAKPAGLRPLASAGVSAMARPSGLESRVRSILGERRRAGLSRPGVAALGAAAAALLVPLAACQLTGRATAPPTPRAQPLAPEAAAAESAGTDSRAAESAAARPPETNPLGSESPEAEAGALRTDAAGANGPPDESVVAAQGSALANLRREGAAHPERRRGDIEADIVSAIGAAHGEWEAVRAAVETALPPGALRVEVSVGAAEARRGDERARREAERARRGAQRAADRSRRHAERETDRARDPQRPRRAALQWPPLPEYPRRAPAPRPAPPPPTPEASGASAWSERLLGWESGLAGLRAAAPHVSGTDAHDLRDALGAMEHALDAIADDADAWVRSRREGEIAEARIGRARAALERLMDQADAACN